MTFKGIGTLMICTGLAVTAVGQSATRRQSVNHRHHQHRVDLSSSTPKSAKEMDAKLAKMENRTANTVKSTHDSPRRKAATVSKLYAPQQKRAANPPINFTYKGPAKKSTMANRSGSSSRGPSMPQTNMGRLGRMR